MDKAKIRIGRFEGSGIAYLIRKGEKYIFEKENKTIKLSENNTVEGKTAQNDMWIVETGAWYTNIPTDYKKGEYQER